MKKNIKIAIDDGSTNIKISYIKNGELLTYVCAHSFAKEHKPSSGDKPGFNITIGEEKLHYTGGSDALRTTNSEYQESAVNLAAIHYALLNSGVCSPEDNPEIDVIVTLPIAKYYTYQNGSNLSKNLKNIKAKKENILRPVEINSGIEKVADTNDYQKIVSFKIANVEVMPEGIPAILTPLFEAKVDDFANTILIDLGGTTLDLSLIVGELSSITPVGYENINVEKVISAIRNAWGVEQSQARISHLIAHHENEQVWEKTFKNPKKREIVKTALYEAVESLSKQVVDAAKKLHKAPEYVFLVGGGAPLVIDAVTDAFGEDAEVTMVHNPQTALAREIAIYHNEESLIEV